MLRFKTHPPTNSDVNKASITFDPPELPSEVFVAKLVAFLVTTVAVGLHP